MQPRDVVIVGGGVIGLTTAYFLTRAGLRVSVLDQGPFGQESSWAGAGITDSRTNTAVAVEITRMTGPSVSVRLKADTT